MSTKTDFLGLILPANNEFNNTWDAPLNDNFTLIDQEIEVISNEIQAARFTKTTLAEFLEVAHFSDGTLKPSTEFSDGRNSVVYGSDEGGNEFTLKIRLDKGDQEVWDARENQPSLLDNLSRRLQNNDYPDTVLTGAKTGSNVPNFLSSSGAEFLLNGDPTPILFNIGGRLMEVAEDISVEATGSDGTKYLCAKKPATPYIQHDRSTQEAGVTTTNSLNNDKVQVFRDTGSNFTTLKIRPGMILQILNTQNTASYIIDEVAFDSNDNQLLILGNFVLAIGSINYKILDPLRPEFSIETSYTTEVGKCIVAEGVFQSGALISSFAYAFKLQFESDFVAIDVSTLPTFEQIFTHNLGVIPRDIKFFSSQANDDSQAWEPLSTALVGNDLAVNVNNTLAFTPGVFTPGSTDASYTPGSLTGDVDASLSGSAYMLRSVQVKVTKTQIFIKNVKNNHFYRDYSGTDRNQGFLKAVCNK